MPRKRPKVIPQKTQVTSIYLSSMKSIQITPRASEAVDPEIQDEAITQGQTNYS